MPDPTHPLQIGDPIPTSAATWNAILAAAEAHRRPRRGAAVPVWATGSGTVECIALNATGGDLREYQPCAITAAGGNDLTDDDAAPAWARRPLLTIGVPAAETDAVAVTLDAIPDGEIGRVAVAGLALSDVDVSGGDLFGRPTPGSTASLTGTDSGGPIRVLDVPDGSGTVRRCAVLIGGGAWQPQPDYIVRICTETDAAGCPTGYQWVTWADDAGNTTCERTECDGCEGDRPAGCGESSAELLATIAALEARVTALEGGGP